MLEGVAAPLLTMGVEEGVGLPEGQPPAVLLALAPTAGMPLPLPVLLEGAGGWAAAVREAESVEEGVGVLLAVGLALRDVLAVLEGLLPAVSEAVGEALTVLLADCVAAGEAVAAAVGAAVCSAALLLLRVGRGKASHPARAVLSES